MFIGTRYGHEGRCQRFYLHKFHKFCVLNKYVSVLWNTDCIFTFTCIFTCTSSVQKVKSYLLNLKYAKYRNECSWMNDLIEWIQKWIMQLKYVSKVKSHLLNLNIPFNRTKAFELSFFKQCTNINSLPISDNMWKH